jgi:hypothetical protein
MDEVLKELQGYWDHHHPNFPSELLLNTLNNSSWRGLLALNKVCAEYPQRCQEVYSAYSWEIFDAVFVATYQPSHQQEQNMIDTLCTTTDRLHEHVSTKEWELMIFDKLSQCTQPLSLRVLLHAFCLLLRSINSTSTLRKGEVIKHPKRP